MGSKKAKMIFATEAVFVFMLIVISSNGQDPTAVSSPDPIKTDGAPKMVFSRALASAICEQQKRFVEEETVQQAIKERSKWQSAILPPSDGKCRDVQWNICPAGSKTAPVICYPFQSVDCKVF